MEDVFVANVFSAGFSGGGENSKIKSDGVHDGDEDDKPKPEVEWLATSSDEDNKDDEKNTDFDVS